MVDIALQRANNDNDKIYMEVIPKELEPIPPARMVNPILVPEPSSIAVSRPIFRNLVPLKIHQAASAYEYKKDTYIKGLCSKLNEATVLAHTYTPYHSYLLNLLLVLLHLKNYQALLKL